MALNLVVNGVTYSFPQSGDQSWGDQVTSWAQAVTTGMLQRAGGNFYLTTDVDFGNTNGLKSLFFSTRSSNPAATGTIRLSNTSDSISFRNNANSGDLSLLVNSSDQLVFNSIPIQNAISVTDTSTIDLTLSAANLTASVIAGSITNSHISSSAAIDYTKLSLAGSIKNSDVSSSAAIDYSKLNLSGSIKNSDVSASAAIDYTKLNLSLSVKNADISASAAIAFSKLAPLTLSKALVSDGSGLVSSSSVTSTELGYLSGVTSAIQTQFAAKADTSSLTAHTGASTGVHGVSGAVVGTTDTQTLTNKTLTAPVIDVATMTDQGSTPANPAAGKHKLYIKSSDGKAYILDSSGVEVVVGGTTITTVDPTAFTPVINGSTTNVTLGTGAVQQGTWWRVGKNLHCDITVVLGTSPTAGSGNAQIPTPSGVTIDTSALGTGARQIVGSGYVQTGGAGSNFPVAVVAATSNVTYVMMEVITGTGTSLNAASAYNTVGNFIKIHFRVPIVGW